MNEDRRVADLTLGELKRELKALIEEEKKEAKQIETATVPRYVYGYEGIARLFNCSLSKAAKMKLAGRLGDAVYQDGRTIVVDTEKALKNVGKEA